MGGKFILRIKYDMEEKIREHIDNLVLRYPVLEECRKDIAMAFDILRKCYSQKKKLLVCGNGGSAADAEHIVGELMKGFKKTRKLTDTEVSQLKGVDYNMGELLAKHLQGALPAIALDGHPSLTTAYMNDCAPLLCFAQQVYGFGLEGDVFLGISTSGNSKNVLYAAVTAKSKGMKVLGLTGGGDNCLAALADVCIKVPERETYKVQEFHLPVYHCLCLMLEDVFF